MDVIKIYPCGFGANTYLVTSDGVHAVAIDPSRPHIGSLARERGLSVDAVLLTHGHFDHIGGCAALQRAGAKIGCAAEEVRLIQSKDNLAIQCGYPVDPFEVDFTVRDGQTLSLCGMDFTVIATPGHTAGGVCYLVGSELFTGDTLFCGGVGRTDFPTGDLSALRNSLKKLVALEGDYTLRTGHGEDGTLDTERRTNPYLAGGRL